jgi:hypothetical protein
MDHFTGPVSGVGASVGREEVIDDAGTVVMVEGTHTGHPCKQQRTRELAHGKLEI